MAIIVVVVCRHFGLTLVSKAKAERSCASGQRRAEK